MNQNAKPEIEAVSRTSQRWKCDECGGDLELVGYKGGDASVTKFYDCVDCGATGDVLFSEGVNGPKLHGSVTTK